MSELSVGYASPTEWCAHSDAESGNRNCVGAEDLVTIRVIGLQDRSCHRSYLAFGKVFFKVPSSVSRTCTYVVASYFYSTSKANVRKEW